MNNHSHSAITFPTVTQNQHWVRKTQYYTEQNRPQSKNRTILPLENIGTSCKNNLRKGNSRRSYCAVRYFWLVFWFGPLFWSSILWYLPRKYEICNIGSVMGINETSYWFCIAEIIYLSNIFHFIINAFIGKFNYSIIQFFVIWK